jgi:hypothetical protein
VCLGVDPTNMPVAKGEGTDRTTSYVDAVIPNAAYMGAESIEGEDLTEAARAATQYRVRLTLLPRLPFPSSFGGPLVCVPCKIVCVW